MDAFQVLKIYSEYQIRLDCYKAVEIVLTSHLFILLRGIIRHVAVLAELNRELGISWFRAFLSVSLSH